MIDKNLSFKLELPLESLKINEEKTKTNRFSLMSTGGRYLMISVINRETKMSWISQIKRALLNLDVSSLWRISSRIIFRILKWKKKTLIGSQQDGSSSSKFSNFKRFCRAKISFLISTSFPLHPTSLPQVQFSSKFITFVRAQWAVSILLINLSIAAFSFSKFACKKFRCFFSCDRSNFFDQKFWKCVFFLFWQIFVLEITGGVSMKNWRQPAMFSSRAWISTSFKSVLAPIFRMKFSQRTTMSESLFTTREFILASGNVWSDIKEVDQLKQYKT